VVSQPDAGLVTHILRIARRSIGRAPDGPLALNDVRQNGRRVDARVHGGDGAAWLVVVWFTDEALTRVESVTVYPRPEPFGGSPRGCVIVLNGPSSVGESSLMRAFAQDAHTPFACLDEPLLGRVPPNFMAWQDTLGPHVEGLLAALGAAAALGNQFLVSAAGIRQDRFESALGGVEAIYVGLDAPLDVLVQRQLTQADKFGGLAEESINVHGGWNYDLRIDTVRHAPEDAARLLAQYFRQRFHRAP